MFILENGVKVENLNNSRLQIGQMTDHITGFCNLIKHLHPFADCAWKRNNQNKALYLFVKH